jgi:predicted secreted protein
MARSTPARTIPGLARAAMNWFTGFVLYALIWWTTLFAVLPIGTRPVADADPDTGWRGAPASVRMGRKIMWTTVAATILWLGCYAVITSSWLSFRSGWLYLPDR